MLLQDISLVNFFSELSENMCLCGRCAERLSGRAQDLRSLSTRLVAASFRARESGDLRRAAAYAEHARAAHAEAKQCTKLAMAMAEQSPVVGRLVGTLASIVSLVATPECSRLPQKWSKQFA